MAIKLEKRPAYTGFQDDATSVCGAVFLVTAGDRNTPVAVLVGAEAHLLPDFIKGKIWLLPDGSWFYQPAPQVFRGGCPFCGGDIVVPHGRSFGACADCGAV